ncbi:helicase HerA domain-containing protein [Halomarina litorea]|uniref:helicase HerA domain-containing protein n=1 Tax=Halomarina litorea TaxID=2961595 RepID=UPI0020C27609|nr:DUF87 domain-containing protein [Halomarina sp. BCD28]
MGETETITVAEVSDGTGSVGTAGTDVSLPAVELLTGRGFVTGKSGSGKSNTASVVIEKLLDRGFPVLIVDIDGEYYGLKEKYEILHVGDDEECDIQVNAEHAEKIADMALRNNVPIILDVSSFLDESEAAELLTEVAKHLFAKEKKLKKPFLLVVEEVHEWIPEGGGLGECGRMLIKVGKRGRKHGLGIMGISQRPADVKKDFITQCDWLCWHRLTWRNDTKVVKRVLGSEYADAVEGLADGEAFLVTDWAERTQRVQFQRKTTFDAGATPGLEDFERPDLKSVSEDLVGELQSITEDEREREDRIEELERELQRKERRIEILERDLEDARDLSRMADQFAEALFDHPGRSRMQLRRDREAERVDSEQATLEENPGLVDATGEAEGEPAGGTPAVESDVPWPDPPTEERDRAAPATTAPGPAVAETDGSGAASGTNGTGARPEGQSSGGRILGSDGSETGDRPLVERVRTLLSDLDPGARRLLAEYRADGPSSPVDAHVAAGGEGDRTTAYSHNSALREAGLIRHAGRGQYAYALPDLVSAAHDGRLSEDEEREVVAAIERDLLD